MADESNKFRDILRKYRVHFGFSQENVASLFFGKRSEYEGVEIGKRTIDLDLAEKIAGIYGLSYCQIIDPKQEIPGVEKLPAATQLLIYKRSEIGLVLNDYEKDVAGNLDRIIYESELLHNPMTADEIRMHFPEPIRNAIKATRITDLLKKSGRDQDVVKVGKRGRQHLFQLKAFADKKRK